MKRLLFVVVLLWQLSAFAQVPVQVSDQVVMRHGRKCYVHIIQKGQTVYSISRAYGLREYEAITTKEIHQLSVGDTVWLPCKDDRIPVTPDPQTKSIEIQPGQTLYGLSKLYGVTVDQILYANPDVAENGLKAGQQIVIPSPDASSQAPAAKAPAAQTSADKNAAQAPAPSVLPMVINPRVDNQAFHITVLMPLYLDQINSISTTKFDLEQRGKKSYKSFEFIQFYEGILMAVDKLERQGIHIALNVVDVSGNVPSALDKEWASHHVAKSDLIIALLQKDMFAHAAQLAQNDHVFIVNPMSTRPEILANPYVIKCMPSIEGQTRILLNTIHKSHPQAHLLVIHSNGKEEAPYLNELKRQLDDRKDIEYSLMDWKAANKLPATINQHPGCVVLNLYNQQRDKNRIQLSNLLNRLASHKSNPPVLMSFVDYTKEYSDVDFSQLQLLSFHTFGTDLNADIPSHSTFMEDFRNTYKTEPQGDYASLGYDIMIFFLNGLQTNGMDFFKTLSFAASAPSDMLFPLRFKRNPDQGFENQTAPFLKMEAFKFSSATKQQK